MRSSKCLTTHKGKAYENVSCFNLQSCARIGRAWRGRRKREKERRAKEKSRARRTSFATGRENSGQANDCGRAGGSRKINGSGQASDSGRSSRQEVPSP